MSCKSRIFSSTFKARSARPFPVVWLVLRFWLSFDRIERANIESTSLSASGERDADAVFVMVVFGFELDFDRLCFSIFWFWEVFDAFLGDFDGFFAGFFSGFTWFLRILRLFCGFSGLCLLKLRFSGLNFSGLSFCGLNFWGLFFWGLNFLGLSFRGLSFLGLSPFLGLSLLLTTVLGGDFLRNVGRDLIGRGLGVLFSSKNWRGISYNFAGFCITRLYRVMCIGL